MSFQDRRRFPRLVCRESIRFRDVLQPGQSFAHAVTRDLSAGGLRITTGTPFSREERVVLVLDLPALAEPARAMARVAWTRPDNFSGRHDTGLEFFGIYPQVRESLAGQVERGVVS